MTTKNMIVGTAALLAAAASGYGIGAGTNPPPAERAPDMHTAMVGMTATLEDKRGNEFDQAFLNEMVLHHEGAVAMAKMVLEKSERPELLNLANAIIAAQTSEIDQMRAWEAAWFGVSHETHAQ